MKENNKKRYLLLTLFLLVIVAITGTYAWLSHRTNDTAMVLTVGNINNLRITLSPYQINKKIAPVLTYEGEPYTTVTAVNNSTVAQDVRLFYKVYNIDSELAIPEFTYTILKSTDSGSTYTPIDSSGSFKVSGASDYDITGNFNNTTDGSEVLILNESIPAGNTYLYQVYIWLDGSSNQNLVSNKRFNAELNAEIISLPDEYQQVEYLEGTGTQYIDTEFVPSSGEYIADIKLQLKTTFTQNAIVGYNYDNSGTRRRSSLGYNSSGLIVFGWGDGNSGYTYVNKNASTNPMNLNTDYYIKLQMFLGTNQTFFDLSTDGISYDRLATASPSSRANPISLDLMKSSDSEYYFKGLIYYAKFYDKSKKLVRNFIPCYRIEDGVAGLYDTVNGVFYTNQGTGDFLVGPNVNQVGNYYRVTFDANGGSVTTSATVVQYGSVYGALPEPTKEGYTFKGWNGKNKFTTSNRPSAGDTGVDGAGWNLSKLSNYNYSFTNNYKVVSFEFLSSNSLVIKSAGNGSGLEFSFNCIPGTAYVLSKQISATSHDLIALFYYDSGGNKIGGTTNAGHSFTTMNGTYFFVLKFRPYVDMGNVVISNIQLEEGTVATPYEPYFIENNTEVVQNKNHTLKAIWEANS